MRAPALCTQPARVCAYLDLCAHARVKRIGFGAWAIATQVMTKSTTACSRNSNAPGAKARRIAPSATPAAILFSRHSLSDGR
jgi:hypothetical protein